MDANQARWDRATPGTQCSPLGSPHWTKFEAPAPGTWYDARAAVNEIMDVLNDGNYPVLRWYVHGVSYVDERLMMYVEIDTSEEAVETPYYYAIDRMYNVRYLLDQTGAIVESYAYDPYGRPLIRECAGRGDMTGNSVLNFTANNNQFTRSRNCQIFDPRADMNADGVVDVNDQSEYDAKKLIWTGSAPSSVKTARSLVGNPYMFQGRPHYVFDTKAEAEDAELMLNDHRNRFADPMTGRWLTRDPIGYQDGLNYFEFVVSNPLQSTDPTGLGKVPHTPPDPCDPDYPDKIQTWCDALREVIANLEAEIVKRIDDLERDDHNLPDIGPPPDRDTREGHRKMIRNKVKQRQRRVDEYNKFCTGPPAVRATKPKTDPEEEVVYELKPAAKAAVATGGVIAGVIIVKKIAGAIMVCFPPTAPVGAACLVTP